MLSLCLFGAVSRPLITGPESDGVLEGEWITQRAAPIILQY